MDSKTVKLNCLTLGEMENEPISKKVEWSFKGGISRLYQKLPIVYLCVYLVYPCLGFSF